jgi:hypothetical protein
MPRRLRCDMIGCTKPREVLVDIDDIRHRFCGDCAENLLENEPEAEKVGELEEVEEQ